MRKLRLRKVSHFSYNHTANTGGEKTFLWWCTFLITMIKILEVLVLQNCQSLEYLREIALKVDAPKQVSVSKYYK